MSNPVPKYSFRPRLKSKYASNKFNPGPGAYNPKKLEKLLQYTMGSKTGNKTLHVGSNSVGPGTYKLPELITRPRAKVVFPKDQRFKMKKVFEMVGPGRYNLPDTKSKIAYSMGPKNKSKIRNKNPGPGHYFPKVSLLHPKSTLGVFGKQKKGKENSVKTRNVGPGSYNPYLTPSHFGYSFGKGKRMRSLKKFKDMPGPGAYDIKSFLEDYPAYATWDINKK
jgi:hypothetical protein